MPARSLVTLAVTMVLSTPVLAQDVLQKHKCTTCHDVSAKKVGPAWKEVAARVSEADIRASLEKGVKGKYGKAAMPPQPKAVPDAAAITKAILAMK